VLCEVFEKKLRRKDCIFLPLNIPLPPLLKETISKEAKMSH
jgi:hypothetical protein